MNNLKIITWNTRRIYSSNIEFWNYFNKINPDIALLQEVKELPILSKYSLYSSFPLTSHNTLQKFQTVILIKGKFLEDIELKTDKEWINQLLEKYKGNIVAKKVLVKDREINLINVYSPAWPIQVSSNIDLKDIKLENNNKLWLADILKYALKNINQNDNWIIGGDFNLSETFDYPTNRGNKEYLEGMEDLGFTECLTAYNGKLVPTFRNPADKRIDHQIDHLFVSRALKDKLMNCRVGDSIVFDMNMSDHLPIIVEFLL
jgi:exonuclease III